MDKVVDLNNADGSDNKQPPQNMNAVIGNMLLQQQQRNAVELGVASGRLRSVYDLAVNAIADNSIDKTIALNNISVLTYDYSRYAMTEEIKARDNKMPVVIFAHNLFPDGMVNREDGLVLLESVLPLARFGAVVTIDCGGVRAYRSDFLNMFVGNFVLSMSREAFQEHIVFRYVPREVADTIDVILENANRYVNDEEFRKTVDENKYLNESK